MNGVSWIKITTDIFDNRKIKQIEAMPDGDALIVIWVKLLCIAGTTNDHGAIYLTPEVPFTDEMLAIEFGKPINTIRLAIQVFQHFGMIEIVDDIVYISNWSKYQNIDGMEKVREQTRKRVADYRAKQKLLEDTKRNDTIQEDTLGNVTQCNVTGNVTVTQCNGTDKDIDIDKEKDTTNVVSKKKVERVFDNDELQTAYEDWLDYKKDKHRFSYSEKGIKSLTSQINKYVEMYGTDTVVELINISIANGWQGIIFGSAKKIYYQNHPDNGNYRGNSSATNRPYKESDYEYDEGDSL